MGKQVIIGTARRMTIIIKDTRGGLPLERRVFDLAYLGIAEGRGRDRAGGTHKLGTELDDKGSTNEIDLLERAAGRSQT
jgi:hypothetical protein